MLPNNAKEILICPRILFNRILFNQLQPYFIVKEFFSFQPIVTIFPCERKFF